VHAVSIAIPIEKIASCKMLLEGMHRPYLLLKLFIKSC
jgi:hypothetical protein